MSSEAPEYIYAWREGLINTYSEDAYSAGIPYRLASSVDALLAERDAEIERLRVRAQELADLAYSYEQRSKEAQDAVIAYECDRQLLIDGLSSANTEIERLQKELRDALDAESTNARNAAHYCSLLSEATDQLAAERQRARLPEELVASINECLSAYVGVSVMRDLLREILEWHNAAVEQKP